MVSSHKNPRTCEVDVSAGFTDGLDAGSSFKSRHHDPYAELLGLFAGFDHVQEVVGIVFDYIRIVKEDGVTAER